MDIKYVITKENSIIVFSATFNHSDFKHMNPIRAGFISFGVNKDGNPTCFCYGRSVSLDMDSNPEKDTLIAKLHLNMLDSY